jgi:RHS repeat-associated protein
VHNGFFLTGELVYGGEHALWRYDGSKPPDTRVYLRDAMGSVIGLMDGEGHLLETFEYDAFGNVRSPGGEALPEVNLGGDSRFQGMWKDAGTGLYYVRARYYDPRTGRFLSRDPAEGQLETPESFHPYVFANNNPRLFRDPAGRFSLRELGAAIMVRGQIAASSIGSAAIAFKNQVQAFARNGAQFVRAVGSRLQSVGGKALELIKLNRGGSRALAERFGMSSERVQLLQKIISKDGSIQTSKTVAKQLLEHPQRRRIPVQSILDAIGSGTRVADPQGVAGQYMYRVQASLNGKTGTLEVLVHEGLGQIRHVLFFTP